MKIQTPVRHFKWKKLNDRLTRTYPCHYESDKEPVFMPHHKQFVKGHIASRINGFNTAYAEIYCTVEWPSLPNQKWGFRLYSHFNGNDAFTQAKKWCDFFLNHPPKGIEKLDKIYFEPK